MSRGGRRGWNGESRGTPRWRHRARCSGIASTPARSRGSVAPSGRDAGTAHCRPARRRRVFAAAHGAGKPPEPR
ncbi:MAG: hypothetical protein DVB27_06345 [Verrucomicrobia bacterium]|nr:MAG: hypothetical protein DVB27_06345 [Verrucomicrobiota bacterium]